MAYLNLTEIFTYLENEIDELYLCSAEPTNYTQASSTYKLAQKLPPTIGSPGAASPNGVQIQVAAITDGAVTGTGTATHWAVCISSGFEGAPVLLAADTLSPSQVLTSGNTFTLGAFTIAIPAAT